MRSQKYEVIQVQCAEINQGKRKHGHSKGATKTIEGLIYSFVVALWAGQVRSHIPSVKFFFLFFLYHQLFRYVGTSPERHSAL